MGPEDEDQLEVQEYEDYSQNFRHDQIDLFLEVFSISTPDISKKQIKLGETNVDINDGLLRKLYESILKDMPEQNISKYRARQPKKEETRSPLQSSLDFKWSGINAALSDKKDLIFLKVLGLKFSQKSSSPDQSKSVDFRLSDFQIIQDDFELLMRHHNTAMKTQTSGRNMVVNSFGNLNDIIESDSDKSNFQTDIVSFSQSVDTPSKTQIRRIIISDFLFVLDFRRLLTIFSIQKSFESHVSNITSRNGASAQSSVENVVKFETDEIEVSVQESYFQLPAREGKKSLFLVIEDLSAKQSQCREERILRLDDKLV